MNENTIIAAVVLWAMLLAIVWLMWWRMREQTFADWLERDADEHHAVQHMIRLHPRGGTHVQVTQWLREH